MVDRPVSLVSTFTHVVKKLLRDYTWKGRFDIHEHHGDVIIGGVSPRVVNGEQVEGDGCRSAW